MSADSTLPVEPQEPAPTPPIQPQVHAPGKPRRPHHKSRTGCLQCKQRKVKCDEHKPICKKCETQGATCSYLQTHPLKRGPPTIQSMLISPNSTTAGSSPQIFSSDKFSPAPSPLPSAMPTSIPPPLLSPAFPASFTMLDMELLHFWTHKSASVFIDVQSNVDLFQTTVVQIAFDYPFLMHEILAISALHLARLHAQKATLYTQASETHANTALALFQPQIASLTAQNCHACFAFSTMLFVHAWAIQDTNKPTALFFRPKALPSDPELVNIKWVKLHRGSQSILQSIYPVLADGPLEVIFTPWRYLDAARQDPLLPVETRIFDDLASAFSPSPPNIQAILTEALHKLKRIFSMLTYYPNISKLSIVMAWFPMISEEYLTMTEQKTPEALLLVLYYCVALKRIEHLWWVKGKAENLLNTVLAELGPGWERWTRWPVEQVLGTGGVMGFGTIMNS